jgi:hypothetical protein
MSIPKPSSDGQKGDYAPFLKPKDISAKGRTKLTVLGNVRLQESQFGTQLLIDVKNGARSYTFAVKLDTPNHRFLFSRFGKSENKWKGAIQVERGEYLGNEFIKIIA